VRTSDEKYDQKLRRANKTAKVIFIILLTLLIPVIIYFILLAIAGKTMM